MKNVSITKFRKSALFFLCSFLMASIWVSCSINGPNYPMVKASKQDVNTKQKMVEQYTQKKTEHSASNTKGDPIIVHSGGSLNGESLNAAHDNAQTATAIQRIASNKKVQKLESKINKISDRKNEFNKEYKASSLSNEQVLIIILAVVLVFLLFGGPGWGWWAFYNLASLLLLALLVVLVLYLAGIL